MIAHAVVTIRKLRGPILGAGLVARCARGVREVERHCARGKSQKRTVSHDEI
jgi:hypothetical protein